MITDSDMREQVKTALGPFVEEYDVNAIVDEIQRYYGTVDVGQVDDVEFWRVVAGHALPPLPK